MPVNWSRLAGSLLAHPRECPELSRTCLSLGNLRRRVVVVSHSELIVSDSEHTCCNIILIYYATYIYHRIRIDEKNSNINTKMLLCHLSVAAVTRNAGKLEPACRIALLAHPREFPALPHVPLLGNLQRHAVVVSHIELVVSDGEHARLHLSPM